MFVSHVALGHFIQMKTADEDSSMVLLHGNELVALAMHQQARAMTQCMSRPYQPHVRTKPHTHTMPYIRRNWEIQRHFGRDPSSDLGVLLPCLKAFGVRGFTDSTSWGFTKVVIGVF